MNSAPHFFEADSALVSRQSPAKHSQASEMCEDLVQAPTANTTARQSGHLSGEDLLSSENNSLATPPGWIGTNLQSFFGTGQEKDDDEEGLDPLSKDFPFTQPNQNYCQVVKVLDQLEAEEYRAHILTSKTRRTPSMISSKRDHAGVAACKCTVF